MINYNCKNYLSKYLYFVIGYISLFCKYSKLFYKTTKLLIIFAKKIYY